MPRIEIIALRRSRVNRAQANGGMERVKEDSGG